MNDNTAKLLEQLANKLGTTSEYLWQILLKQAPIDATITLIQTIGVILFGVLLYRLHKNFSKEEHGTYDSMYHNNSGLAIPMFIACLIFIVLAIATFICMGSIITGYFNPEYWALEKILSSIRPIN